MHRAVVVPTRPARNIGEPRVRVDERRLNLERCLLVHAVPMNHVSDLETGKAYLPYAFNLVVEIIAVEALLGADERGDAIALALPDIEGLSVSQVDESVDMPPQLASYVCRERLPR